MNKKSDWKTNPAIAVIAIAVILVVVVTSWAMKKSRDNPPPKRPVIIVIDEETNEIYELQISAGQKPPYKSKTGRETAWQAVMCQNCWTVFPMKKTPINANECPVCKMRVAQPVTHIPGIQ